jgi:hypothetical protein
MLPHTTSSNRPPLDRVPTTIPHNATMRPAAICSAMSGSISGTGGLRHSTAWTIRSIERCTGPRTTVMCTPAGLAGPARVVEAVEGGGTGTVDEGGVAEERDVVDCCFHQYMIFGSGRSGMNLQRKSHTDAYTIL